MPHLIFKGVTSNEVSKISENLIESLAITIDCPVDHFTVEWQETVFFRQGKQGMGGYPFVTMNWFARPQPLQDQVAKLITDSVMSQGYDEVCVMFNVLEPTRYYDNGEHY